MWKAQMGISHENYDQVIAKVMEQSNHQDREES